MPRSISRIGSNLRPTRHPNRPWFVAALLAIAVVTGACGDITVEPTTHSCGEQGDIAGSDTDRIRAAVFAIRAGGSAGFLDEGPTFKDYVDTRVTDDGYQATFEPQLAVDLVLDGSTWKVVHVDGKIDEETCFTLLGYSEPDSTEAAEHEFRKVRLRPQNRRSATRAALIGSPVWMGPIPYEGYRSRCYAQIYDEAGEATHRTRFYPIEIPEEETDRTSGTTFIEIPGDEESASGEFICETIPR